LNFYTDF